MVDSLTRVAERTGKPVLVARTGADFLAPKASAALRAAGIPAYPTPARAVRALAGLWETRPGRGRTRLNAAGEPLRPPARTRSSSSGCWPRQGCRSRAAGWSPDRATRRMPWPRSAARRSSRRSCRACCTRPRPAAWSSASPRRRPRRRTSGWPRSAAASWSRRSCAAGRRSWSAWRRRRSGRCSRSASGGVLTEVARRRRLPAAAGLGGRRARHARRAARCRGPARCSRPAGPRRRGTGAAARRRLVAGGVRGSRGTSSTSTRSRCCRTAYGSSTRPTSHRAASS